MSLVHEASKRALVVGGTSGIGQGIAMALAKREYEVIVCGRSAERGNAIVASLPSLGSSVTAEGGKGGGSDRHHSFVPIDAFDLSSVKSAAEQAVAGGSKLDVLVMTQSMATLQGHTPTRNGLDQKLQLHYFSRVYLACLLAPHMNVAPSSPPRILSVLSAGVHSKYKHVEEDFELKNHYSVKNAADAAGYYTDAGFERFAADHPNLVVCHAAPGFVNTNWGTEMPWAVRMVLRPLQSMFGKSLEACGETLTTGLLDTIKSPGFYLMGEKGQILDKNTVKHTPQERDMVWEKTLQLLPELN
jgi:NAD(P)-dependent dehydrogenase (short-subunit alcohol dehydrogenase family)